MVKDVEISMLDLRYESCRLRQRSVEARLLDSIAQRGIEEPLEGVELGDGFALLNGFKRYRCARKLGLTNVPFRSFGRDEAIGIVALLRASNAQSLSILEQAGFVDELKRMHQMSVAQIAEALSCSKGWVGMRLGLLGEMPDAVRQKLFAGAFPVYAYMYTVRPFMRMNKVTPSEISEFVVSLSGKNLSVREIEQLTHGYFRGSESFRDQIRHGDVTLPLEQLRQAAQTAEGCTQFEQVMLKDLEIAHKYLQRVTGKSHDPRLKTPAFRAQAQLLLAGFLSRVPNFLQSVRQLHDRCGQM
ncbi:MAG: chromosome partitioning protein ParB [bacterium]